MQRSDRSGSYNVDPRSIVLMVPFVAVLVLAVVASLDCYATVGPTEAGVLLRFGRKQAILGPGLHFKLPFADEVIRVDLKEQRFRLPYERTPEGKPLSRRGAPDDLNLMLTGDLNAVAVEWTVQWRVHDPYKYLVAMSERDVPTAIKAAAFTVMNRLVGDYSFDEILTEMREEVGKRAIVETQQLLDKFDLGVRVTGLQLQRIHPPDSVRAAFDSVIAAIQERQQKEHEAEKERNTLIPQAIARADQYRREAEGKAAALKAEALGRTQALLARYRAYAQAPQETRERLYLEAMEEVLSKAGSVWIMDEKLQSVLPLLDLKKQ